MRRSDLKFTDRGAYYHLFNRVGGPCVQTPFKAADREYGVRLLLNLCDYFLLEVVSYVWMGNHFHLVAYAPPETDLPSNAELAERHNRYVRTMRKRYPHYPGREIDPRNRSACRRIGRRMIDISDFMKAYQQQFATAYNRIHDANGALWAGRFKSVLLEGNTALLNCLYYVELNPVRAGMSNVPTACRHSSWGRYAATGEHPFRTNFVKHVRAALGPDGARMSDVELFDYAGDMMSRIIDCETNAPPTTSRDTMRVRYLSRTRHFTEGAILGSKAFVTRVALRFLPEGQARRKQLSRSAPPGTEPLYCFKKLRQSAI